MPLSYNAPGRGVRSSRGTGPRAHSRHTILLSPQHLAAPDQLADGGNSEVYAWENNRVLKLSGRVLGARDPAEMQYAQAVTRWDTDAAR